MHLTLDDYLIIAAACAAMALRILADIREVVSARAVNRTVKAIVKRSFSPSLTVFIPLETVNDTKRIVKELQNHDLTISTVVVIDSSLHFGAAAALRYYVKSNQIKNSKIVSRKKINLYKEVRKATTKLAVVLPDTTTIFETFYHDAILPFGDKRIDGVALLSCVRPGKTISGGIESLASAVRQYTEYKLCTFNQDDSFPEAIIIRTKYIHKPLKRSLILLNTQKAVYSIAAGRDVRTNWNNALRTAATIDFVTTFLALGIALTMIRVQGDFVVILGLCGLLFAILAWWSLGLARIQLFDRMAMTLLAPLFIFVAMASTLSFALRRIKPGRHTKSPLQRQRTKYA